MIVKQTIKKPLNKDISQLSVQVKWIHLYKSEGGGRYPLNLHMIASDLNIEWSFVTYSAEISNNDTSLISP
jgi:hypothetical protein